MSPRTRATAHLAAMLCALLLALAGGFVLYHGRNGFHDRELIFAGACFLLATALAARAELTAALGAVAPFAAMLPWSKPAPTGDTSTATGGES